MAQAVKATSSEKLISLSDLLAQPARTQEEARHRDSVPELKLMPKAPQANVKLDRCFLIQAVAVVFKIIQAKESPLRKLMVLHWDRIKTLKAHSLDTKSH